METMIQVFKWYLILLLIGGIGFPFCYSVLRKLPGRGFAFSRIFGLILTGYLYWLGCSLGLFKNQFGSLVLVILVCVVFSVMLYLRNRTEITVWLSGSKRYLVVTEVVFVLFFALMVLFRLSSPEISGTEKPMEMTFINGILRSAEFPPNDTWLSGYSISYYYFGYVMAAFLTMLSGVPAAVGFNLMLAAVFGMAAAAAFSLVNDLLELRESSGKLRAHLRAWLAPIFVLLAGNFEGFLEILHALRLFWSADNTSSFWSWIRLKELSEAPVRAATADPTGRSGIWWWRASRVLTDFGLNGSEKEVIDEFPMFSFQLGDLHPHVIGIPFVIFAAAIALNVLLRESSVEKRGSYFASLFISRPKPAWKDTWMGAWLCSPEFLFSALSIGSLIFINTWDFPFYFGLYCLCVVAAYLLRNQWNFSAVFTVLFEAALPLGSACLLLYGLFLVSLSSQAGGIAPSGFFVTRPVHLWIMFGFFMLPILVWIIGKSRKCASSCKRAGIKTALIVFLLLFALESLLVLVLTLPVVKEGSGLLGTASRAFWDVQGLNNVADSRSHMVAFFSIRLKTLLTPILLLVFIGGAVMLFLQGSESKTEKERHFLGIDVFIGLMILIAAALVLFPEYFYLRDFFGTRMNTIFKFYYQAWILFALSAAYIVGRAFSVLKGFQKAAFSVVWGMSLLMVLVYPWFCIRGKFDGLDRSALTLDGSAFLQRSRSDDWEGIRWIQQAEYGVVLEKVGESYSQDNAVSTFSGFPAVQGPANHESQWRGGYSEMGSRRDDVRRIYETRDWSLAKTLLETYDVRYVFIGSAERSAYNVQESKFEKNLQRVFSSNGCKIYQVY